MLNPIPPCSTCGAPMAHRDLCSGDKAPPRCARCQHALSHGACPQCEPAQFSRVCDPPVVITLTVSGYHASLLQLLARSYPVGGTTPNEALEHFLGHLWQGIERVGSWERAALLSFFSDDWSERGALGRQHLAVDPTSLRTDGTYYRVMLPRGSFDGDPGSEAGESGSEAGEEPGEKFVEGDEFTFDTVTIRGKIAAAWRATAAKLLQEHGGRAAFVSHQHETRLTMAVRLQQVHPALTLDQAAAVLFKVSKEQE